jgi:hypothetical protein
VERLNSWILNRADRTHIEDVKNPDEFLIPSRNLVLIALGDDESDHRIPLALLIDLPSHLGHGSTIDSHR